MQPSGSGPLWSDYQKIRKFIFAWFQSLFIDVFQSGNFFISQLYFCHEEFSDQEFWHLGAKNPGFWQRENDLCSLHISIFNHAAAWKLLQFCVSQTSVACKQKPRRIAMQMGSPRRPSAHSSVLGNWSTDGNSLIFGDLAHYEPMCSVSDYDVPWKSQARRTNFFCKSFFLGNGAGQWFVSLSFPSRTLATVDFP